MQARMRSLFRGLKKALLSRYKMNLYQRLHFVSRITLESLEDRRLLAPVHVDNPIDYLITTDTAPMGMSNGDTVTWNPGAGSQHGAAVPNLIFGTNAFGTIQAAVTAAVAGDMILVGPGTFTEAVNVNKQLFVRGNQFGVDAQGGRVGASETVVAGGGATPINVAASDVEVNGFTIQGATISATPFGVVLGGGTSGSEIRNNIIENNIAGLALANNSASNQTIIEQNLFRNNDLPGSASGSGIYSDQFVAGGALTNVLITENTFASHDGGGAAINFSSTTTGSQSNVAMMCNIFDGNSRALLAFNLIDSSFTQNEVSNSNFATSADLRIFEGVNNFAIANNILQGNGTAFSGLRVSNGGSGAPNASNITFQQNSVSGYGTAGLELVAGQYTGPLNAESNWWGAATGPTHPSNPGGTGLAVVDPGSQVDVIPFLTSGTDDDPATCGFQVSTAPDLGLACEVITENLPGDPGTVELLDDADNPGSGALVVTGTSGRDVIIVEPRPSNRSELRVRLNGRTVSIVDRDDVQHIVVFGGAGHDTIIVNASLTTAATLFGDEGNDYLYGAKGADGLDGGEGTDHLFGGAGDDNICGGNGNDFVYGQGGNDMVGGDAGNDRVFGEGGNDLVLGGDGNDFTYGGIGNDQVFGQAGNDRAFGESGQDTVVGGDGNDFVYGGAHRDVVIGGAGADHLFGEAHDDILIAGSTTFDEDPDALFALLVDWNSTDSYSVRVDNLATGAGSSGIILDDTTLIEDDAVDDLFGGGGLDLFLIGLGDRVRDRSNTEQVL